MIRTCLFISILLFSVGLFKASGQSRKVIIDCDPGVDDATALILALNYPRFEIVGITTVFGNAYLDQTTKNALTVVELSKRNIPVYKGADKPLRKSLDSPPDFIHWPDAELLLDNSEVVKGRDILAAWGSAIRMGVKEMSFSTTDITGSPAFIIETGNYEMKGEHQSILDKGKYVVVWEKRNNEWKLYRDIGSTSMPAAK